MPQSYLWSFACFQIGVEQGGGNYTCETALRYIFLISRAYAIHHVYYLGKLIEKGVLSQQESQTYSVFMLEKVEAWGTELRTSEEKSMHLLNVKTLNS